MSTATLATGLTTSGQFPLNSQTQFKTLADMRDLGINLTNPFKYYEDMKVNCIEDHKEYIWREKLDSDAVNSGVLAQDYTYPEGSEADDIVYSNRVFNFYEVVSGGGVDVDKSLQDVLSVGNVATSNIRLFGSNIEVNDENTTIGASARGDLLFTTQGAAIFDIGGTGSSAVVLNTTGHLFNNASGSIQMRYSSLGHQLQATNTSNQSGVLTMPFSGAWTMPANKTGVVALVSDIPVFAAPSGLEAITESGNTGLRVIGKLPSDFEDIGENATDISSFSGTPYGAVGNNSFASGLGTRASSFGEATVGLFNEIRAVVEGSPAPNLTAWSPIDHAFTVGIGQSDASRADGFVVQKGGIVRAPGMTNDMISSDDTLITKAYADANYSGGGVTEDYAIRDQENTFTQRNIFNGNVVMLGDGSSPNIFNNATQHNGALTVAGGLNSNGTTTLAGTLNFSGTMQMGGTMAYTSVVTNQIIDNASDDIIINKRWFNANIPSGGGGTAPTGLELISEGGNSGWRLIGKDPASYGNIGNNAVDFSRGNGNSSTRGATQSDSFAANFNTTASGFYSFAANVNTVASGVGATAFGAQTTASGDNSFATNQTNTASGAGSSAFGVLNTAPSQGEMVVGVHATTYLPQSTSNFNSGDRAFVVGIGPNGIDRKDGLRVFKNGLVELPELTDALIDTSLSTPITRRYADNNYSRGTETFAATVVVTSAVLNTEFPIATNPVGSIVLDTNNFNSYMRVSNTAWRQIQMTAV